MNTTETIRIMLEQGLSYKEISAKTKLTKATISYHAAKLGMSNPRVEPNLEILTRLYESGLSVAETAKQLGIGKVAASKALKKNKVSMRSNKADIEKMFIENSLVGRNAIKNRLIKENMLENKCSDCGLEQSWNGKPIVMVLDHINGVNNDNRIENLRFLCPNCNSQTPTFAGRNVKHNKD